MLKQEQHGRVVSTLAFHSIGMNLGTAIEKKYQPFPAQFFAPNTYTGYQT
jgi:hypothetical protein